MKKEKYENHLMHNCTEKGCFKSPKNKLKEEIKETIEKQINNELEGLTNEKRIDDITAKILALLTKELKRETKDAMLRQCGYDKRKFEKEREKWAEEREKTIDKIEKSSETYFK